MVARKNFTITEVKADDSLGSFEGVLSTYGNIDRVGDICEPGCFDASIAEKGTRFPLCWNHNDNEIVGSFNVVSTDSNLLIKGKFNFGVQRAKEIYSLLKEGDVKGLSIGYSTKRATYDQDGIRHLLEVDLWEGSLTAFPANPMAEAQAKTTMKGNTQGIIRSRLSKSLSLKRFTKEDRDEILALLDKAFEDEEDCKTDEETPEDETPDEESDPSSKKEEEEEPQEGDEDDSEDVKHIMTPEVKRLLRDNLSALQELKKEMNA